MLKGDEEWTVPQLCKLLVTTLEMAGGECYVPLSATRPSNSRHFQPEGGDTLKINCWGSPGRKQ